MTSIDYSRRGFLRDVVVMGGGALVLGACSSTPAAPGDPSPGQTPDSGGGSRGGGSVEGLPDIEGATQILDPAEFPTSFQEPPEFAEMVEAGELPPVAERVGSHPLVLQPVHEIGQYGGQVRRGFVGQSDWQNAVRFCSGPDSLLYWDYQYENVVPQIARDYELNEDGTVLTLHLREGMKWSDGEPFTADDIIFWREDVNLNPEISGGSLNMQIGGKDVVVEKVDDYTVRYVSPVPNPLLPARMASWTDISGPAQNAASGGGGFMPKHYLTQFLPAYTSEEEADRLAADAGFDGWRAYFQDRASWHLNPDLPSLTPWVVTRPINNPPWEFAANPYSIWVDNVGNQLPYIGKITMSNLENLEVLGLRAAAGDFDVQERHLGVTNLPVLLENQEKSGYTIHRSPFTELDCGIRLNLAYEKDQVMGDLIRTVEFRRALSLGIERDQINEAFFLGTCVPSAVMPPEGSIYDPGPEWRTKWATHDPDQANALLDEIGLTDKDNAGYRLRPDGGGRIRMEFEGIASFVDFPGIGEMVKRHWGQIGIDMNVQTIEGNLGIERTLANEIMLTAHTASTDDPFLRADAFLPTVTNNWTGLIGIPYAKWFISNGKDGTEPPDSLGLHEAMDLLQEGLSAEEEERMEIGKELFRMHADQVWSIGVVGFGLSSYGVYLTNNDLRNVPARVVGALQTKSINNAYPMTFYYDA